MSRVTRRPFLVPTIGCLFLFSCGYHVGGRADTIPKGIQTISVPPFHNSTMKYKLTDELPQAIDREFATKTRFHVEQNPGLADAVLNGSVNTVFIAPTVYNPASGTATSVQVIAILNINLVERTTGRVLYSRPNFEAKSIFEIAVDPHQFFNEADPAYDRLSRDVARNIVSAIMENF